MRRTHSKNSAKEVVNNISCVVLCRGFGIEVGGLHARCVELKIAYARGDCGGSRCSLGVELDFRRIPTRSLDVFVCKVCGFVGCVAIPNE
jgi:hypothetical protein